MIVVVNCFEYEMPEGASVGDVLRAIKAPETGIAVARGDEVVPRAAWDTTTVRDGDGIEVLTAVQGG
ncbi:MAG TPA: sulfur carrier protein ThiS [Pseudonocardiaceae bacterium]|jgi:sulfur carrier protein|nr:sulfur carrier protein ThiS [Pseudonocardiaceae bacterium]